AVEAAIEEFGLTPYRSVRVGRLSQGNRQRLGLAIALHHHPQFVVLDEPTNALDPGGMITLRQVLAQRAEAGAGILVSTHHLDEVSRIAHTITMINRGRIIGQLDPAASGLERAFFDAIYDDDRRHGWISS
ncbi:MAG TPA: ATP-binding cassette domain-containing protein, partial [Beutenbergiaceae bacterium]|nr:ATP-binding cassette domain-containing protein [Beutenbergiaceae bacterium]